MWFLIPLAATAGFLLLKRATSEKDPVEFKLEHRRIYICHSFADTRSYKKIVRKLKLAEKYKVWNHSIPRHKQKNVTSDEELRNAFRSQIRGCSHVFVLATKGIPKKSYVSMEIEVAKELNKKIFAIKPHGSNYVPKFIRDCRPEYISTNVRAVHRVLKSNNLTI